MVVGAHVPAPVLKRVAEAAGGNPLFALELMRAVLDSPPDAIDPARQSSARSPGGRSSVSPSTERS